MSTGIPVLMTREISTKLRLNSEALGHFRVGTLGRIGH